MPTDRTGKTVNEVSVIPNMRPRTGKLGSDKELAQLLEDALQSLSNCDCSFWACRGPTRPQHMVTCTKCWAMRQIGTVVASLKHRTNKELPTA